MKSQILLANLVLVFALCFGLAFACGETNRPDEPISTENQNAQGPRLGKYHVLTYGAPTNPPIRLGHFELLSGGKYKFYDNGGNFVGEGKYSFDAASNTVEWLSGIFKDYGWGGEFTIEREGKTHKIRLKSSTIGTNSTDSNSNKNNYKPNNSMDVRRKQLLSYNASS